MAVEAATTFAPDADRLGSPTVFLPKKSLLRQLIRDRTALVGLLILVVMFGLALAAPLVAPYDPNDADVVNRYASPSAEHWLGTDNLGRDEFSRLLFGARIS